MMSIFGNFNAFSDKHEKAIKEALLNALTESSEDVKSEFERKQQVSLEVCESTSALCMTLEALFLHGLKDSLLAQTLSVIAGDNDQKPEPSFWSPLLVLLHKDVIKQINSLPQITTEIGQCRAWVRLTLNESLFTSYLQNIQKNRSALKPYYKKYAIIIDKDYINMACKILRNLEMSIGFQLAINSSLLNHWPDYSLQLSGLWTPPLKSCPISTGEDITKYLTSNQNEPIAIPQPIRTNVVFNESIATSPLKSSDEHLKKNPMVDSILAKVDEMQIIPEAEDKRGESSNDDTSEVVLRKKKPNALHLKTNEREHSIDSSNNPFGSDSSDFKKYIQEFYNETIGNCQTPNSSMCGGNSLLNLMQSSWTSDENTENAQSTTSTPTNEPITLSRQNSRTSRNYSSILLRFEENHLPLWATFFENDFQNKSPLSKNRDPDGEEDSFEILSQEDCDKFTVDELQSMIIQLCKLPQEQGLDAQGFVCKSCQHPLGIGSSNFGVCGFSGNYFCETCMSLESVYIPSRIIYNWDFRKYLISKKAEVFLNDYRAHAFIDLKALNPMIYEASEAMSELQALRIRLNFIRAYLFTCSRESTKKLEETFFGRKYLYESIHAYSIDDLSLVLRGTLYQQLHSAYKMGETHILKCPLCSLKGFICEICNSPRVLYPFHIDTTYRCEECGAVFHPECLNVNQPCPKCERRKKREVQKIYEACFSPSDEH